MHTFLMYQRIIRLIIESDQHTTPDNVDLLHAISKTSENPMAVPQLAYNRNNPFNQIIIALSHDRHSA